MPAKGSTYIETMRVQIHANVRIRRIYFSDRLYTEEEMPNEFKMFLPVIGKKEEKKPPEEKKAAKETEKAPGKKEQVEKKPSQVVEKLDLEQEIIPSGAPPTPIPEEGPVSEGNHAQLCETRNKITLI